MIKKILGLLSVALAVGSFNAQAAELKDGHPERYEVEKGDTLWDISATFLSEPWLWPELWHANPQVSNPHLIYPGDVLKLVYIDGKPALMVSERGAIKYKPGDTVKLTPQIRSTPIDTVIPAIPLEHVQAFLRNHRVVERIELEKAPYVLAGGEERIILGGGDYLYARDTVKSWKDTGEAFGVFRGGGAYIDPETEEVLGYEAKEIGLVKRENVDDQIAKFSVISANEDIRIKDRLLQTEDRKLDAVFYPKSPKEQVSGRILHVFNGVRNVSQYDVVVINRGVRENMEVGDVLAIYRQGEQVRDSFTNELIQLPSERSGLMIIFRTFEKVSYGLVLRTSIPLSLMDEVRNP